MTSAGGRNGSAERRARGALALCRDVAPLGARQLRGAVATGVVGAASGVGLLTTSAWLITRASLRPAVLALGVAIGAVQGFALARGVARYGERLALHDVSLDVLSRLRLRLFDRLATLVPGGLGRRRAGEVLTAFVSDADDVAESLARVVTAGVDASAGAALAVAVAAVVEPLAGAALAVGATATALVSARLARMSRSAAGREAAARADVADAVVAAVRSAPELVAHGRSDLVRREVAAAERRGGRASARSALLAGARRAAVLVLGTATVAAVLVAGLTARDAHRIGGVSLAVLAFASLAALEPFAALADALGSAVAGDVAARRIGALDLLAPPAPEPPAPAEAPGRPAELALEAAVVDREGRRVLDGASVAVAPGTVVAVVGPSGSGKTTVVLTLVHFLECSRGRAALGGVDLRTIARDDLRRRVGWAPEDAHVFAATLRANLLVAEPDASDEACRRALREVGLDRWLETTDAGLDTRVGTGGRPMSAGERQRVGLARALLGAPDVLVLDEPTAHLDRAGATLAIARLARLARRGSRRSVLVASHDPEAVSAADTVVALEEGRSRAGAVRDR